MKDNDEITELAASPIPVQETNRLYRLAHDLSRPSRQIARRPCGDRGECTSHGDDGRSHGPGLAHASSFVADSMETPSATWSEMSYSQSPSHQEAEGTLMPKLKDNARKSLSSWATDILLESHVIVPCPDHGCLRLRHSHHAVDYAFSLAEHRKFLGKNKKERVKAVGKVLDGLADTCPACD